MKFAATRTINGVETVGVVLPLSKVPSFDQSNPPPGAYTVPDEVQPGWVRQANGTFVAPPVIDVLRVQIIDACQKRLTEFVATRGYSSLESISKYKDITDAEIASLPAQDRPLVTKFRAECRYVALATAQTWAVLYRGLAEVEAGTRPMPTSYADIEPELPALAWPV